MRASSLTCENAQDKVRLVHMAEAYDTLAMRIKRGSRRQVP